MKQDEFLHQLQQQAARQAQLASHSWLPSQLTGVAAFVGKYPWQVGVVVSCIGAVVLEVYK